MEAMSRRSPGATSLPLQLGEASLGIEIWTGNQNTSLGGWVDLQGADVERDLPIRALQNGPTGQFRSSGRASCGLATVDDGSTEEVQRRGRGGTVGRPPGEGVFEQFTVPCASGSDRNLLPVRQACS